jgi:plasmid stabilization system protein ParE
MVEKIKIIWTETAQEDLYNIYIFLSHFSQQSARNIVRKILHKPKTLIAGFENAGAKDNINPNYRRLIVGNYKILYTIKENLIFINSIFDCRQDPEKLKNI